MNKFDLKYRKYRHCRSRTLKKIYLKKKEKEILSVFVITKASYEKKIHKIFKDKYLYFRKYEDNKIVQFRENVS